MSDPEKLTVVTRASPLARWQAEYVCAQLRKHYPACKLNLLMRTTRADKILDRPLSQFGGKGLFVKELEDALLHEQADLAVHSLKDVPTDLPQSLALCAILARTEPRDALVSNHYANLAELPPGARVGTSSLRRESQLRARYPYLDVHPLRGNLQTRLQKLDRGEYEAILLAAAGLQRLGLDARIRTILDVEDSLPAVGQGALGIEIRAVREDVRVWTQPLVCPITTACVQAERAVARALGGACYIPLAVYAQVERESLAPVVYLRARIATRDGRRMIRAEARGPVDAPEALGNHVAQLLWQGGAAEILATLSPPSASTGITPTLPSSPA